MLPFFIAEMILFMLTDTCSWDDERELFDIEGFHKMLQGSIHLLILKVSNFQQLHEV